MVAWEMCLCTPECPSGRTVVVIANDVTHIIGSFGPREDALFSAASLHARSLHVPRIFLACNSGARIGLADECKSLFRVAWKDSLNPDKVLINKLEYIAFISCHFLSNKFITK